MTFDTSTIEPNNYVWEGTPVFLLEELELFEILRIYKSLPMEQWDSQNFVLTRKIDFDMSIDQKERAFKEPAECTLRLNVIKWGSGMNSYIRRGTYIITVKGDGEGRLECHLHPEE